jgi:hypothetical protein
MYAEENYPTAAINVVLTRAIRLMRTSVPGRRRVRDVIPADTTSSLPTNGQALVAAAEARP